MNLTLDELIRLGRVPPEVVEAIEKERAAWVDYCNTLGGYGNEPQTPALIRTLLG